LHDRLFFAGRAKITIGASAWKIFPKCTREMVSHVALPVQDRFIRHQPPGLLLPMVGSQHGSIAYRSTSGRRSWRAGRHTPTKRTIRRRGGVQIVELPWGRWRKTESIYHLESAGLSRPGLCRAGERAFGANGGHASPGSGSNERPMHGVSFAVPVGRIFPPNNVGTDR